MWHHCLTLHLGDGILIFGQKLFTSTLILKKCRLSWGTPVRYVKGTDVRNLRQGKRRSLRHLNTTKPERLPPTTEQKKALRSSQASLNGSLSTNCTTQPPRWSTLLLLSTQIHMTAEWTSGRAGSLSLWSFHFMASDSPPKCCDIYLLCNVSPSCSPLLRKLVVT